MKLVKTLMPGRYRAHLLLVGRAVQIQRGQREVDPQGQTEGHEAPQPHLVALQIQLLDLGALRQVLSQDHSTCGSAGKH